MKSLGKLRTFFRGLVCKIIVLTACFVRIIVSFTKLLGRSLKWSQKFSFAFLVLFFSFLFTWLICSEVLTKRLDFSNVFESTGEVPTVGATSNGIAAEFSGINGDKLIISIPMPRLTTNDGKVRFAFPDNGAEHLSVTPKTQSEIQSSLTDIDPKQWQILTKLPSPIFRFNLKLVSDVASPNNGKKFSYYLVTSADGKTRKVSPGQTTAIGRGVPVEDIGGVLFAIKIELYYSDMMKPTFLDNSGKPVSQATGSILIEPAFGSECFVFIGVWVFLLGLLALLKQTFLLPKDVKQVKDWYKHGK